MMTAANGIEMRANLTVYAVLWATALAAAAQYASTRLLQAQTTDPGQHIQKVYKDIFVHEDSDRIVFGNDRLSLQIEATTGAWSGFFAEGISGNLIAPPKTAGVDFRIGDEWKVATQNEQYKGYRIQVDASHERVTLITMFDVGKAVRSTPIPPQWQALATSPSTVEQPAYEYELDCSYTLGPGSAHLSRSAHVTRRPDGNPMGNTAVQFEGFLFQLPGVNVGPAGEMVVESPGPVVPDAYVPPLAPYTAQSTHFADLGSAPDNTFGLAAFYNTKTRKFITNWMNTAGQVGYETYLAGDGKSITVLHHDLKAEWFREGQTIDSESDESSIGEGTLADVFAGYRQMLTKDMPLSADTPDWAKKTVLLEVLPSYFHDGIKGLIAKLPFYRSVGFNTIYLMPHWRGGYMPVDPYEVNPDAGTEADLKQLVFSAHMLGMRVLFDMVIHGFDQHSPIISAHPEFFQRDKYGLLTGHPDWGSIILDPASPAYQQYLIHLALHDIRTYGIDGYRVDANSFRSPNWDPASHNEPWQSAAGTVPLLTDLYRAMRAEKPDTVLLSEVFGPVWHGISNLVHDDMTMGPQYLLELMDKGEFTPALYKQRMSDEFHALLPGSTRVYFGRNHDTSWFYHFNGYSPRFLAIDAVHAFTGVPEVFAGDPEHGPNPDDDPAVFEFYGKIFAARREFPELTNGKVLLDEVHNSNPWVFTGARQDNGHATLFLVSFKGDGQSVNLEADAHALGTAGFLSDAHLLAAYDPISGRKWSVPCRYDGNRLKLSLKLSAYEIVLIRTGNAQD